MIKLKMKKKRVKKILKKIYFKINSFNNSLMIYIYFLSFNIINSIFLKIKNKINYL